MGQTKDLLRRDFVVRIPLHFFGVPLFSALNF